MSRAGPSKRSSSRVAVAANAADAPADSLRGTLGYRQGGLALRAAPTAMSVTF